MALGKMCPTDDPRGKVLLLAQEIAFAKVLAGNNKRLRDRGIKKLKKWLTVRSRGECEFTDDDFMRICKGLFYCMWMADKLIVQEELAETISRLIHCFNRTSLAVSFVKCFFRTMVNEWFGIDQFRYDKFMTLVRRFLRQTFEFCRKHEWNEKVTEEICNSFTATILSEPNSITNTCPLSLVMHFCDIYLQELSKVGRGQLPTEVVTRFLQPFILYLIEQSDGRMKRKVKNDVFYYLMKQSDVAVEFEEKFTAWKMAGCPGNSWEDMVQVEEDEEEVKQEEKNETGGGEEEKNDGDDDDDDDADDDDAQECESETESEDCPLDPRAGRVNVELPQLDFDAQAISEALLRQSETCVRKKQKLFLESLAKQFTKFAEGSYPLVSAEHVTLRPKKIQKFKLKNYVHKAALKLNNFEQREIKKGRRRRRNRGQKKQETTLGTLKAHRELENTEGKRQSTRGAKKKSKTKKSADSDAKLMQMNNEPENVDFQEAVNTEPKVSTAQATGAKKKKKNLMKFYTDVNQRDSKSSNVGTQLGEDTKFENSEELARRMKRKKLVEANKVKEEHDECLKFPQMKRKCGLLLSEIEDMNVNLCHLKRKKKDDSSSKGNTKRRSSRSSASAAEVRRSVGDNWEVSDFVNTNPKEELDLVIPSSWELRGNCEKQSPFRLSDAMLVKGEICRY
ncbi:ribosomal RNA processing protein 1 homolog A isoform X2 [Periplaneta americana]|uniref:ribosomal RNA processing protein 1 homolog A isoform X2 n=1 Tax=Periplaneta americana TaxID=6978 RepID=UPI0037E8C37D